LINQQHGEQQSHPAVEHPDALVNRMAHSIGFYAARTYLGIQNITHKAHEETDRQNQMERKPIDQSGESAQRSEQAQEPQQSRTRKAEEMVDYLTQRLSSLTAMLKFNFQRTTAHVREDTEDIWAEAQSIRHHRKQPLPQ
jgi:DNA-binding ferritin-like protein